MITVDEVKSVFDIDNWYDIREDEAYFYVNIDWLISERCTFYPHPTMLRFFLSKYKVIDDFFWNIYPIYN